jgi:hypothetical protein
MLYGGGVKRYALYAQIRGFKKNRHGGGDAKIWLHAQTGFDLGI